MDVPRETAVEIDCNKSSKSILKPIQEGGMKYPTVQRSIGFLDEDLDPDHEPDTPDATFAKKQALKSTDSFHSSGSNHESRKRPIIETWSAKLYFMRRGILALFLNLLLLVFALVLVSEEGFVVHFHEMEMPLEQVTPVLMVSLMILVHLLTYQGFTDSLAVYFGIRLSQPQGYTFAAVGMVQSSFWSKLTFANHVTPGKGAKGLFTKISLGYLLHSFLLFIPVFSVLEMGSRTREIDEGTLSCAVYHQNGKQMDRGWPTSQIAMGTAEYLFGTSIGRLRSQESVPHTLFVSPPQLLDVCEDGTTIMGPGFTAQIDTECVCAGSPFVLAENGIPSQDASQYVDAYTSIGLHAGMINGIYWNNQSIEIYTLLTRTHLCGDGPIPLCTTKIHSLYHADIQVRYMTDGSSASLAPQRAHVLKVQGKAQLEWLYRGLVWLHGGNITTTLLPSTTPNSVNSLLWWTTPNTMVVSPSLVEAGIETTFAILSKAAIQRSFLTQGKLCQQRIVLMDELVASLTPKGFLITLLFVLGQCGMQCVAMYWTGMWFFQKELSLAGIQCCHCPWYLSSFLCAPILSVRVQELSATLDDAFWSRLDVTVRVGESISTLEDPDFGIIVADKPKLVGSLSPTKLYP
jgi:hypothetical protein